MQVTQMWEKGQGTSAARANKLYKMNQASVNEHLKSLWYKGVWRVPKQVHNVTISGINDPNIQSIIQNVQMSNREKLQRIVDFKSGGSLNRTFYQG